MLESLANIRLDLEKTAVHFEELSQALAGHLVFSSHRALNIPTDDIPSKIKSIDSVAEVLRAAAARMGSPGP
ncbi:hypothetical protein N5D61_15845 [Pseudomonas sp. GD03842]|uniref:hypothetical protein n=1 Tax=unclassified Pseudomonas TaxID=196821 RepID=UPI000D3B1B37|nr:MULTISPECIES: hypothetical protein [unclassified Pseudomonas]MDH0747809.1 hypothetical protein [Pseudomonas sp. GD03842]RAU40343.1 hypothetical protein DBP26_024625 [Pseudomonas sp. RIT 409]RAU55500.1 hypothetical protein DBY65_006260 [Pseudomonas sp. RIT 412]